MPWLRCALLPVCVSVSLSDAGAGIDCAPWEGLAVVRGGGGDYGLSSPPPIDLWGCEVSLVQMDGSQLPYGATVLVASLGCAD